ncbi:MAG: hypothetical protein ACXVCI_16470, partial [Bdellovibrionota bacterium]
MQALLLLALLLPLRGFAAEGGLEVDALLATVGRDAVLLSDIQRFADVDKVLQCAGVVKRKDALPTDRKALLNAYIDEELFYQEARLKKTNTAGQIPLSVQMIQSKAACREKWLALGDRYSKVWKTETRTKEGEGMLVRELEKRVLVERFRKSEVVQDV